MPRASSSALSTDRQVGAATPPPPGKDRAEYRIAKAPGLVLRVTAAGTRSWGYWIKDVRTRRWRMLTLGVYSEELGLAWARREAKRLSVMVDSGDDPFAVRQKRAEAFTVAALGAVYIERHAKPKKRSWAEDARSLQHDIYPVLGRTRAEDVTRSEIVRLLDGVVDRGAPIQANRLRALLSKLFRWAVAEGYLNASPASGIPARVAENPRSRNLTDDELRTVWLSLEGGAGIDPITADAIRLQLLLGARIQEITGMRQDELSIDATPPTWSLPAPRGKTRGFTRPLPPLATSILRRRLIAAGSGQFVFPSPVRRGRPLGEQAPTRAIARLILKGLMPADFSSHDLRRTFATGCARLGVPRDVTARLLAHAPARNDTLGRVYDQHSYTSEMLDALLTWERHVIEVTRSGYSRSTNVITLRRVGDT